MDVFACISFPLYPLFQGSRQNRPKAEDEGASRGQGFNSIITVIMFQVFITLAF